MGVNNLVCNLGKKSKIHIGLRPVFLSGMGGRTWHLVGRRAEPSKGVQLVSALLFHSSSWKELWLCSAMCTRR